MKDSFEQSVKKIYASLDLRRKIVGVRIINTKEEFDALDAKSPKRPMNYCGMVKAAACGHAIKGMNDDFACRSGPRVLGIDPSDPKNSNGENWARLGIYCDENLSREVRKSLSYSSKKAYGVLVQPIESYDSVPDIVLFVTTPYNCMRLIQGYAYHYGMPKGVNMIGNQAICLECSARPYVTQDLNASMLCIGTRHRAGWDDEEMSIGVPGSRFQSLVDGVFQTINIMESNANKERIQSEMEKAGISDIEIRYDYNYYMDV